MKKYVSSKKINFPPLLNNHSVKRNHINVYPQMPQRQIQHYLKITKDKKKKIFIQLKPSSYSKSFVEISGKIIHSNKKNQIVLNSIGENTSHIVQIKYINHIRLDK